MITKSVDFTSPVTSRNPNSPTDFASMSLLPFVAVSTEAMKQIRKKGNSLTIVRHPSAGRYGYSGDKLDVQVKKPADVNEFVYIEQDGLHIYLSKNLSVENYEQLNIWMKTHFGILKKLSARITLYRRLIP